MAAKKIDPSVICSIVIAGILAPGRHDRMTAIAIRMKLKATDLSIIELPGICFLDSMNMAPRTKPSNPQVNGMPTTKGTYVVLTMLGVVLDRTAEIFGNTTYKLTALTVP